MRRRSGAIAVLAVSLGLVAAPAPAGAQVPVSAFPSPGTLTASTGSQISLRGRPPGKLGRIEVIGSRSGRHTGRVRAHSDGLGASFVLDRPLRSDEGVLVQTHLPIIGGKKGDYRFRTARRPRRVVIPHTIFERIEPGKRQRLRSRTDLRPPVVTVNSVAAGVSPGQIILGAKPKLDGPQSGPMILDEQGRTRYYVPMGGRRQAMDVRVQRYRGRPVLTYWRGTSRQGIGAGELVILDDRYRPVRRVQLGNGLIADLHEFLITDRDTALVIGYPAVRVDLSGVGGHRRGTAIDSVIQEIDLATGLVIFEWHSIGKVALAESYSPAPVSARVPHDYFHANSVSLDLDGDVLVSARNTWGVYKISRRTGQILWRLGGKRSSFKMGRGTTFAWQHDARRRADGALTLFDNGAAPPVRKRSRALTLRLDERAKTARVERAFVHPRGLLAATQGNAQSLPSGGFMVGWGSQRFFTEYAADGRVVFDARLAVGFETYRAYRSLWVGRPPTRPRVAGVPRGNGIDVFASWNGATEVASWEVLAGSSPGTLRPVGAGPFRGLETQLFVPTRAAFVAARARDAAGAVLATSPARRVSG